MTSVKIHLLIEAPEFTFGPSPRTNTMSPDITNLAEPVSDSERNVRARIDYGFDLVPYDQGVHIPGFLEVTTVEKMMEDDCNTQRSILHLQLIRIVSGSNSGQNNTSAFQSYLRKNKKEEGSTMSNYFRLFLFRDVNSKKGDVVYMVEAKCTNERLWLRNTSFRDNGTITIGTYIAVINPRPITTKLINDIPMVETHGSCIVMKNPTYPVREVPVEMSVINNMTKFFVLNNVKLTVHSTNVQATSCGGYFCDKQRVIEIVRGTRACGCYSMESRSGSVTLFHSVSISKEHGMKTIHMDDFSSLSFSNLYLKKPLSSSVKVNHLDFTDAYFELLKSVDEVVSLINTDGGFSVIGWYKRGSINDVSHEEAQNQVESSDVNYHIVKIYPTSDAVLKKPEYNKTLFEMSALH